MIFGLAGSAQGQGRQDHFDTFVQKPATSPLGLFTLEGAAVGDGPEWLALRADYGHGLLALENAGPLSGNVIPDRWDLHLLASWGYKHFLELGVDVPLTVYQRDGFDRVRNFYRGLGVDEATIGRLFPALPHTGFGDIRFVPKIALPFHRPFSVALIPEIRLRTGLDAGFMGDQYGPINGHAGPIFAPRAVAEGTVWRLRLVGELGYQIRGEDQYFNLVVGDQLTFGIGAEYALPQVTPSIVSWEAIAEFNGNTQVKAPFTFGNSSTNYKTPLELAGGVRARFAGGWLAFAGIGSGLSGGGYGRELFRAFAGVGYEPPNSGSSVPVPEQEQDSDHDGLPDGQDKCPTQPGPLETDGCPDRDSDGIPDADDQCPDDAGTVENDGCPVETPIVTFKPPKLHLNAGITFETGKADIKKESYPIVDAVAKFLLAHPEIKKVLVEGHTDNRGSEKINLDLSKRRAKSVVQFLVTRGVAQERLSSDGFGFSRPIATNDTAIGRAKNRRVEFTVIEPKMEGSEEPSGGDTGAKAAPRSAPPEAKTAAPEKKPEPKAAEKKAPSEEKKPSGEAKAPEPKPAAKPAPSKTAPSPDGGSR